MGNRIKVKDLSMILIPLFLFVKYVFKTSTFLASFIRSVLRIRHEGKAEWKMGHGAKGNMIIYMEKRNK